MKFTDNIVKRIGADGVMHCSIAALAVAVAGNFDSPIIAIVIGVLVCFLCWMKEIMWDVSFSWKDLLCGWAGAVITVTFKIIIFLIQ